MSENKNLQQQACKHHSLSWTLTYENIETMMKGHTLKAPHISMGDEIDQYVRIDSEDKKFADLKKFIENQKKSKKSKQQEKK